MSQVLGYYALALVALVVIVRLVAHLRVELARRRFLHRLRIDTCREAR
ncbi:hypothetical protein UFOVP998_46 [uncultured Caudovirales phage]|uniref:Heme exporter protein D n=1 Tax=uncultured Caudovirales phage TaxID=2100421 RepID=A0A6J5Q7G3_9CAUD|nr:hypothetical protein UFOVP998_46 [uncultured Caudovirales phage]CAB4199017.1 hypothetical protein UFOVP1331_13 [uncultured Caudovirales phage]CAB4213106.1 hypothetical protein UFOVP1442_62 [uncultured Caudovirales phage]CAB5228092.1 hypothetical protein UFOVP1535_51 [uncultured Caudovirales phage]